MSLQKENVGKTWRTYIYNRLLITVFGLVQTGVQCPDVKHFYQNMRRCHSVDLVDKQRGWS